MKSLFALLFAASFNSQETPLLNSDNYKEVLSNVKPSSHSFQKDSKATDILHEVTKTTKSRKTITLNFTFTVKNGDMEEVQKGDLKIKNNQYWYSIFGTTKISDGKSVAEVIKEDKEVSISLTNFNDPDEFSPQEMFTIYEKGYKYRHMGKKTENGAILDLIDLYPDADNMQPYRRITLFVNTSTSEIKKIELFHKTSAKIFTVDVNESIYDNEIPNSIFKCECDRWPEDKGWDCDDQRNSK
tara:strand:- start:1743 stop:2468 length:726 start_codon:yes stop_codon:yes gene_type:complete